MSESKVDSWHVDIQLCQGQEMVATKRFYFMRNPGDALEIYKEILETLKNSGQE